MHFPAALIFDMDGTMVDNMGVHQRVWLEILAEHGAQIDPATFHQLTAGKTNPEILRTYLRLDLSDVEIAALSAEKEARYRRAFQEHLQPVKGLVEFLHAVGQAGIPLAVASAAGWNNIDFVLDGIGIRSCFSVIVSGDEVQNGKPHPEMFLTAAARLGVQPQDCIVFEDSPGGVESAHRAGMQAILVTTSMVKEETHRAPGVICVVPDYTALDLQNLCPGINLR
jgi:beta-phosphoglucomutase family hydrolase